MMAAEHINSIFNLVFLIRHHFEVLTESWYPARLPEPKVDNADKKLEISAKSI